MRYIKGVHVFVKKNCCELKFIEVLVVNFCGVLLISLLFIDEYITVVFDVPGSLLLQKKANSDTFSVETEASSFQSFGTPRGNLCYGPRHLNNAAGDWSKV